MSGKTMVVLQAKIDELNSITPTQAAEGVNEITKPVSTMDSFLQLIGLVILLIVILVAAYYTSKFVGNMKLGQMKNSNFTLIDAYRISPNKVIQIVKIANKYVVIAIAKDTIQYITELDEAAIYLREPHEGERISFKQILDKLKNNKK